MNKLKVQPPITTGNFIASYDATSVSDTNWHDLSSTDFYDAVTGTQLPSGLRFSNVVVISNSTSNLAYLKFRALDTPTDGTSNTDGVIPFASSFSFDIQTLEAENPQTIAFKKAQASNTFFLIASFVRA